MGLEQPPKPLQSSSGIGFAVMDGGTPCNAGTMVSANSCLRINPTHQIELGTGLQDVFNACQLFYPYGPVQIFRGNAITD